LKLVEKNNQLKAEENRLEELNQKYENLKYANCMPVTNITRPQ